MGRWRSPTYQQLALEPTNKNVAIGCKRCRSDDVLSLAPLLHSWLSAPQWKGRQLPREKHGDMVRQLAVKLTGKDCLYPYHWNHRFEVSGWMVGYGGVSDSWRTPHSLFALCNFGLIAKDPHQVGHLHLHNSGVVPVCCPQHRKICPMRQIPSVWKLGNQRYIHPIPSEKMNDPVCAFGGGGCKMPILILSLISCVRSWPHSSNLCSDLFSNILNSNLDSNYLKKWEPVSQIVPSLPHDFGGSSWPTPTWIDKKHPQHSTITA